MPGPIDVKYRFDSCRTRYRYVFYERERWTWSGGIALNIRDAEIGLQQGALRRVEKNTGVVPLLALEGQWRFAPGWCGRLDFEGLAARQGRAIDAALKPGYDVTPWACSSRGGLVGWVGSSGGLATCRAIYRQRALSILPRYLRTAAQA